MTAPDLNQRHVGKVFHYCANSGYSPCTPVVLLFASSPVAGMVVPMVLPSVMTGATMAPQGGPFYASYSERYQAGSFHDPDTCPIAREWDQPRGAA